MQLKKSLCTLALACGLMALPVLAQNSQSSTPPPDNSASPSATAPNSSPTDQAPAASSGSISDQSSNTSAGGQSGSSADSSSVQSTIQSALQKDDQLAGQSVNAEVSGKKVTLTGTVSSQAQKDHAEQVATQAAAGYTVKNKIKVSGSSDSGAMPPKQ